MKTGGFSAALRIFNPDGSEAEKSGNGLRRFLIVEIFRLRFGKEERVTP
jgi:diaminopimelate epimerase